MTYLEKLAMNPNLAIHVDEALKVIMTKYNCTLEDVKSGLMNNNKILVHQFVKLLSLGLAVTDNQEEL